MTKEKIVQAVAAYVQDKLTGEGSGHDWWHIVRVRNLTQQLALAEGGDAFICQIAALVHDLADEKLATSEEAGLLEMETLLAQAGLTGEEVDQVLEIVKGISYKGGHQVGQLLSLEGQIVQDADRLDAIGAIGIARTMAYSGYHHRIIHDPERAIRETMTLEEYRSNQGTAITHFYEKLLKLKDLMNTDRAKQLSKERHQFLETYLEQFYAEWEGRR